MLEVRTTSFERQGNRIAGYAAVYDAPSLPLVVRNVNGGKPFTERVARGAFDRSLAANISLLVGHDRRELLANTFWGRQCCQIFRRLTRSRGEEIAEAFNGRLEMHPGDHLRWV